MRIPVKSERDAFRLIYGTIAVLAAAVLLGALTAPIAGIALLAGVLLGALAWEFLSEDPERAAPLREAAASARTAPGDDRHRVLVVANETVAGRELRAELEERARGAEVRVVCPILPSRAHLIASDIDREIGEARTRLESTLAWGGEHGFTLSGRVSEDTPLVAAADELRRFPADEVIISTHPHSRSKWLEANLVERMREELDIPVTHVVVDLSRSEVSA